MEKLNYQNMGPVEKAVLQQALYNQSKREAPAMRRCDHCNVIFNSRVQAETHYKGRKHARAMYLKRVRENKHPPARSNLTLGGEIVDYDKDEKFIDSTLTRPNPEENPAEEQTLNMESCYTSAMKATEIESDRDTISVTSVCRIKYKNIKTFSKTSEKNSGNGNRYEPYHHSKTPCVTNSDETTNENFLKTENKIIDGGKQSDAEEEMSNGIDRFPEDKFTSDSSLTSLRIDSVDTIIKSRVSSANESKNYSTDELNKDNSLTQRQPVALPDPLPHYIKRVERPTVLKESLRCNVCDIYVNSENQMKQHVNSLRHKNIAQGIPTPPKIGKEEKPKTKAEQFRCDVCQVTLNSDIQLLQHLSSQRHRNILEGKPPKPRWTPFDRNPPAAARSIAQLALPLPALPAATPGLIIPPKINAPIAFPGLPLPQNNDFIGRGPHLKQTSFLPPSRGLYQTREIILVGAATPGYPTTVQPQIQLPQPQIQLPQHVEYMLCHTGQEQPSLGIEWTTGRLVT